MKGLRRAPRWILAGIVTVLLACLLAVSGVANSAIGNDADADPSGNASSVPSSILNGGAIIDATGDSVVSYDVPDKTIVLTFDDGPSDTYTEEILSVLEKYDVDGTFFEVGSNITKYPDEVKDLVDSGSEIGLHTFTHPDLTKVSDTRMELELSETQLALSGAAGVTSNLVRPPYSATPKALDNDDYSEVQKLGDLGYITVLTDLDSEDWQTDLSVDQMVANATPENGEGAVILMHDAGGDRSKTVAMLEQLIPKLKAEGYTFTTVSGALNMAKSNGAASASDQWRGKVLVGAVGVSTGFLTTLSWSLVGVGVLTVGRLGLMLVFARRHKKKRRDPGFRWGPPVRAPVSVIVPAYNEKECIEDTIRSLLASDHPVEIIVVDDGSTDNTAELARGIGHPAVRVIEQRNGGKASALNTGIAAARHELIVMMDGDTVFEPTTVGRLVQPFADPEVGAVAGNAKIANRRGLLGKWQHIEYVMGFNIDRRVYDSLRCMLTVPGAVGAFRRRALLEVGGVSDDTLAEDTDLTIALSRKGWRVVYEERARAWTEAPSKIRQLWMQRYRWCYGTIQSMWKHRRAIFQKGPSGRIGRWGLLHLALFQVVLPTMAPLIDILTVYGMFFLNPWLTGGLWLAMLLVQLLGAVYAFRLDGEKLRPLWLLPLQQIVYRQLMYGVLIQSVMTALAGTRLRWQKLRRSGGLGSALPAPGAGPGTISDLPAVSGPAPRSGAQPGNTEDRR
ncbi:glycosyltransferase [Amycolatopsis acidicola]|uniref:Glycosyltransferase n=1 Tax=Amycolatopsis acidicola TaxID=2596893 RepID=A0A5N0UUB1_9PSEU|nr:glycosyltransferase [Amycolatopsis acidicola]